MEEEKKEKLMWYYNEDAINLEILSLPEGYGKEDIEVKS